MENKQQKIENKGKAIETKIKMTRKRVLTILKEPNARRVLNIINYLKYLKNNPDKITDSENPLYRAFHKKKSSNNRENLDPKLSKNKSKSSANANNPEIPQKKKTPSKSKNIVIKPHEYCSIFDNNLLRSNGSETGCECTVLEKMEYENPFFSDIFEEVADKKLTVKCALVCNNAVKKIHVLTFDPIEEFQHIVTRLKPTLHASEYVTCGEDAIGCKYSLTVKLTKNNLIVGEHVVEHIFTNAEKKFLEIKISDYSDFDHIYYSHSVSGTPKIKLDLEKVYSFAIGESVFMLLSNTIQWTEPGPKVIVEKIEQLPGHIFY